MRRIAKIRTQGYFPTKVKEKAAKKQKGAAAAAGGAASGATKKKGFNISFGGVSTKTITTFTRQLSTLQDAGLPILRSLKILWQQQKPGLLKNVLDGVANDVESGSTLSEAMSRHPKAFDRLYVNMVQAGETGGVLDVILQRLAGIHGKCSAAALAARGRGHDLSCSRRDLLLGVYRHGHHDFCRAQVPRNLQGTSAPRRRP